MSFFSKMKEKLRPVQADEVDEQPAASEAKPSDVRILQYRWLASDFLRKVLGETNAWVSDGSSLWDFHEDDTNDAYYVVIDEIYGVDVRDVKDAILVDIFEKIDREAKVRFWLMEDPPIDSLVQ
jgi:hypothetical protein